EECAPVTTGAAPPLLDVRNLTVELRIGSAWIPVVDSLTLSVAPSEILGVVGESGCGKTLTALALAGLLPPTARARGDVYLLGHNLLTLSEREMRLRRGRDVAMIFQEPRRSLNPAFTVGEQIAEAVRCHELLSRRAAWQRAVELLELVEI